MNPSIQGAIDSRTVERLLEWRQKKAREPECSGMAAVACVLAGGADAEQIQAAARHLDECAGCRELVQAYQSVEGASLPAHKPHRPPGSFFRLAWAPLGLALFLGAGALVWTKVAPDDPEGAAVGFLLKGQADHLDIAVQRGQLRFTARPGDELVAGDRLGFFYSAAQPGFLILLDLEASGRSTVLYPVGRQQSGAIRAGHQVALPDNGTAREGDGCEWLVAVFSDRPLFVSEVRDELQSALPAHFPGCDLKADLPEARTVWVFSVR